MLLSKKARDYVLIERDTIDIDYLYASLEEHSPMKDIPVERGEYRLSYYNGETFEEDDVDYLKFFYSDFLEHKLTDADLKQECENTKHEVYCIEMQLKGKSFRHNSPKWEYIGEVNGTNGLVGFVWDEGGKEDDENRSLSARIPQGTCLKKWGYYASIEENAHWFGYYDYFDIFGIKENGKYIALLICVPPTIPSNFKNTFAYKLDKGESL